MEEKMILLYTLLLGIGFTALIRGADLFVDGSSALAGNFKIPGVVIGLTIVALGTSAPELAVSTSAALHNANEIALSNIVGSNIFNLLCVLGLCAILHPLPVDAKILKRDFLISIGATAALLPIACLGTINRTIGLIMVAIFFLYILYLIYDARKNPDKEAPKEHTPLWKCSAFIITGLIFIIAGGQAVVYSARELAKAIGISETLIGLTIVAIGTSLPELVTSVVAARKGEIGLAIGNVIGSNIFNLLFILGISAAIHPVAVNTESVCDIMILTGVSIITCIFSFSRRTINRTEGIFMVLLYAADILYAVMR